MMKRQKNIRVKTLAWIEQDGHLFVVKMHDKVDGDDYYRPVGGCVEFGETTAAALHREIKEELDTDIMITGEPLVLENIFISDGYPGHEIVYLFPSRFTDPKFLLHEIHPLTEANGESFDAMWVDLTSFLSGALCLVPDGLLDWYRARSIS